MHIDYHTPDGCVNYISLQLVKKERYWRRVIREAARSGVSIRQFCRERRLKESQFYSNEQGAIEGRTASTRLGNSGEGVLEEEAGRADGIVEKMKAGWEGKEVTFDASGSE